MISEPRLAYVWIWLPGGVEPIVCGKLDDDGKTIGFVYAQSYLARTDAVPIYEPELPLRRGPQFAVDGPRLPLCIDDAMPDSWGRTVINHRLGESTTDFGELTYLLNSGSDRIGALDFQPAHDTYTFRGGPHPDLADLAEAARRLQRGERLDSELSEALAQGSSLGGARPKALLRDAGRSLIAKFSSESDHYPVVQGEYVAMELARLCGLDVAPVEIRRTAGRYALLVERFDRESDGSRHRIVTALTVLGLNTFPSGRYATYTSLADAIRAQFARPDADLHELFARISFNILCGNTDDHGRNHAAFVGDELSLTPAYDICPQARGTEARQAMAFGRGTDGRAGAREARVGLLVSSAGEYHLVAKDARAIVDHQIAVIRSNWDDVCEAAELTAGQRDAFMETQFLNDYASS